jgi:hypothetical protein
MSRAIPPELLLQIFNDVELEGQTDLLSIRLANKTLSSLVTPICFRTIHVSDTLDRVTHMMSIQDNQVLASLVKQISFRQKVGNGSYEVEHVQYGTHEESFTGMPSLDAYTTTC